MPSRRTHTKSRHGCIECKSRKVKCDETRPQCRRCTTRQGTCHYSEPFRGNNLQETTSASASILNSRLQTPIDPITPNPLQSPFPSQLSSQIPSNTLKEIFQTHSPSTTAAYSDGTFQIGHRNWDMELLHHYTTSPTILIDRSEYLKEIWRIIIPKLAFSNNYLLHGLLCLSACHIYHVPSEGQDVEQYANLAKHHYMKGLSLFRPMLSYIDAENASPIVAFSMILTISSMGLPSGLEPEPATPSSYIKNVAATLQLVHGVKQVLSQCWPLIEQDFMAPLVKSDRESGKAVLGFEAEVALRCIEARINSDISEPSLKAEYLAAANDLRECNPRKAVGVATESIVLAWPAIIPSHFFQELNEENPIAIAIFAFFGTLMHNLDDLWWAVGKGKKIVEATTELLPRGWESVVVWAKMSVGLPCDYTPLT